MNGNRQSIRIGPRTPPLVLATALLGSLALPAGPAQADPPEIPFAAVEADDTLEDPRPVIGALRVPLEELPQISNFEVVGETIIPNPGDNIERGRNGGIGIANQCLYVGNRQGWRTGTEMDVPPEVAIVNIRDPRHPRVVNYLPTILGATSRELRAFSAPLNTLFVQNFRVAPFEDDEELNNIQIYDVSDCFRPRLTATVFLDGPEAPDNARPHEFFVWLDPHDPARILLYVSFSGGDDVPDLRVYEVLNAPDPTNEETISIPIATFTLDPAIPRVREIDPERWDPDHFVFRTEMPTTQSTNVHSMSVSQDGTRVYMANRIGFFILDSSLLAADEDCIPDTVTVDETTNTDPNLCLRKINPDPEGGMLSLHPPYAGITHSAVPVPPREEDDDRGVQYVLIGGERNGTDTCPWTWGSVVHTVDELNPQFVSRFMVPENVAEISCVEGGIGDPALEREFSTHQITAFPNLFFISWYSAGLRAWDIVEPNIPLEVGVFVPAPRDFVVERFRESPDVWVWPFPVLHNGLVYIADENGGLYVLRYTGPHADELPQEGTFQGNASYPFHPSPPAG